VPVCPCPKCQQGPKCYLCSCGACDIPAGDLTIVIGGTYFGGAFNGTYTLSKQCGCLWQTDQITAAGNTFQWVLECIEGQGPTVTQFRRPGVGVINSTPPSFTQPPGSSCGASFSQFYEVYPASAGSLTYTVTGPNIAFGSCPVCFKVVGCGARALSGATVTVMNGMTTVATGTTTTCGDLVLDVGTAGTYQVSVTEPSNRFAVFSESRNLKCGEAQPSLQLVPAAGYHCSCLGTAYPLPNTIHLSSSIGGGALVWTAVSPGCPNTFPTWYGGTGALTFGPGNGYGCPPMTVNGVWTFGFLGGLCAPILWSMYDQTVCPGIATGCNGMGPLGFAQTGGTFFPLNLTFSNTSPNWEGVPTTYPPRSAPGQNAARRTA
jgi:hypothetical protein